MNAVTAHQPHSNNVLDRGIPVWIQLRKLARNERRTVDQIAALEMTTSLTDLVVDFMYYEPTHQNNRRTIEPLCRCLSNLRCRNENQPLRNLTLQNADLRYHAGMLDVVQQFLIAATKYGGIYHLKLCSVELEFLPVQFLIEFCRENNNLKVLELYSVTFSDGSAEMSLPPNRPPDPSVALVLDKLSLVHLCFENSTAVTVFADFIARMTVQALKLSDICAHGSDIEITARILSEIKIPAVKQLELNIRCRIEHFRAALEAGTTSVIELHVAIDYRKNDSTERLKLLINFIPRAVQLHSIMIRALVFRDRPALIRAMELCATVTRIQVDDGSKRCCFSRDELQQLQGIAARNEELGRFVASPSTYPTENLLELMRQFENCPTGRYMLARHLPEISSFEKGDCLFPTRKRDPTPMPPRQLRKRKNISYKV